MKMITDCRDRYDAVIIGGGPAGSAAGLFLSDMGFKICIVEKKAFPRDTLCGEFLSREVIYRIAKWGFLNEFLLLKPNKINSFRFINTDGGFLKSGLNFPAYGLSRYLFDNFLLNKAKQNNTDVLTPAKVLSVEHSGNEFITKIFYKDIHAEINSKFVIGAYGKRNLLDRYFNRKFINSSTGYTGIKFHARGSDFMNLIRNEINIFTGDDIYCGINTVEGGQVTVCWLEKKFKFRRRPEERISDFLRNSKVLSETVPYESFGEKKYPIYGSGNIYFGKKEVVRRRVFMIGDAAGVIAPVAGDGIGIAFESAEILSNILSECLHGRIGRDKAEDIYRQEWDDKFKKRFFYSSVIQKIILGKQMRGTALKLTGFSPGIAGRLVELTRG